MRHLHRFWLLCATGVGAAVLAGPVFASRPAPSELPNSVATTHFVVHYQSNLTFRGNATQATAGSVGATAERAYSAELADGYAAPLPDATLGGDSRIDIYIADLSSFEALGISIPDAGGPQSSGYIMLDGRTPDQAFAAHTIAHELFHLIQFGLWASGGFSDGWLYESTAEWMGYRATGYDISGGLELGPPEMSLDCSDPRGLAGCDPSDPYANGGYSRWGFFEYLSEKLGPSFVQSVFAQAAGSRTGIGGLAGALTAQGTTLADTYNAWSTADMSGGYSTSALQSYRPTPVKTVSPGAKATTFLSASVPVDHLATEYIAFDKGAGSCVAGTLSVAVTIPAGTLSKPAFFLDAKGSTPVQLTVSGSRASATIPWDTCASPGGLGYLSLPNASQTVDGAAFGVTASLAIDAAKPVAATPAPAVVAPPLVAATPSTALAPTINVFGPELLTLSSATQQIRLTVAASGAGVLQARLGTLSLGSQKLRIGTNDLRFTLPRDTFSALRRSAATPSVLTLTPTAAGGAVAGPSVTRTISVTPLKRTPAAGKTKVPRRSSAGRNG